MKDLRKIMEMEDTRIAGEGLDNSVFQLTVVKSMFLLHGSCLLYAFSQITQGS